MFRLFFFLLLFTFFSLNFSQSGACVLLKLGSATQTGSESVLTVESAWGIRYCGALVFQLLIQTRQIEAPGFYFYGRQVPLKGSKCSPLSIKKFPTWLWPKLGAQEILPLLGA